MAIHISFYIKEELLGLNIISKIWWFEEEKKLINNGKVPVFMVYLLELSVECHWQHQQHQKYLLDICITANYTKVSTVWINLTASLPPREHSYMHMSQHMKSFKDIMIAIKKKNILFLATARTHHFFPSLARPWLEFFWISYCSMMATVYFQNNCGFKPQGNWHNLCSLSERRKIKNTAWMLLNLWTALKLLMLSVDLNYKLLCSF